jgi:tetratricopeptide (TPR) repeat protein
MARRARASLAIATVALLLAGAAAAFFLWRREPPLPPPPSALEAQLDAWREAGLLPPAAKRDAAAAADRLREAQAALAADLPSRTADALRLFREALALFPYRSDAAIAGYATAFAETSGEDPDGAALRGAHEIVRAALADGPHPDLLAAYARLLLLVPGEANVAEALAVARQATSIAPGDPGARLALALATQPADPAGAGRQLEEAWAAAPTDRRLLGAAARARWAAGDAVGALALADRRLALDPGHPGALGLQADVLAACDRIEEARAVLARWDAADPRSPLPPLLLARIAYQREGDLAQARRLLETALSRQPDDFVAARALAHRAAVEIASGDVPAAEGAVAQALARVPGSAPARFQAALLAFRRGDASALRESARGLGDRGGTLARRLLAARSAELSGTDEEAQEAYEAVAAAAPRDPAVLLGAAGALARLRAGGPALALAARALDRDVAEGRLRRAPTDFWEGPGPLAEASRRLEALARAESRGGAVAYAAAAAAELLLGRTVPAERLARLSAGASPQALAPLAILGQVALDRGKARQAVLLAEAAVEAHPHEPLALELRARVLEALGRSHDAERAHRDALEAGPDLVTPRLALARLLARRGAAPEARAILEPLVAQEPGLSEARGALAGLARTQ